MEGKCISENSIYNCTISSNFTKGTQRISRGASHKNNSFPYLPMKQHLNHNLSDAPNFSAKSLLETNKLSNKLTNKLILKMLMITNLIILLLCNQLLIQDIQNISQFSRNLDVKAFLQDNSSFP